MHIFLLSNGNLSDRVEPPFSRNGNVSNGGAKNIINSNGNLSDGGETPFLTNGSEFSDGGSTALWKR